MKKLIIFLCALCFTASVASADGVIKRRIIGGGASCATQSYDVQYTSYNTTSSVQTGDERGQSWLSGVSKTLYSISIYSTNTTSGITFTFRVGTSADLSSSYLVEFTCDLPTVSGWKECVIPEGSRPALSASTTYHSLFKETYAGFLISRDSTGGYAGGTSYYDTNKNWIGTTSTSDLPFQIKVCD